VLGLFRPTIDDLASELARFIHKVVHGTGHRFSNVGLQFDIRLSPKGGSAADIALLTSSPREYTTGNPPRQRLPWLLRTHLSQQKPPISVFNPRGQSLELIPTVQILCGLMLDCIDPGGTVQSNISRLPQSVANVLGNWRNAARQHITSNPSPHQPSTLASFVNAWQTRTPFQRRIQVRENVALNELVYKLVTWIAPMQDDIEHLVYLEAITRTVSQSALFGNFSAEIVFEPRLPLSGLAQASVREAIWNIFTPLATGAVEVNEDLLETLPSDRISIMSIHQSKGLEFPLVIVDIGSDFKNAHSAHAFKRFPRNPGKACAMEDELRPYSPLGISGRSGLDRAFDDLIRQYFVAYSRAQDVLLLVGLDSVRNGIPNVATGWERTGQWHWQTGLPNLVHL
jgi:DNA helicase-2/ATP-dependent DNA helicase PcrA